jgi:phage shock protein PspC (stress-responsive transcriptional regulator)
MVEELAPRLAHTLRMQGWMRTRGYVRPHSGRMLAGVIAGLARKWDMNVWALRVLFVLSFVLPGPQFLVYVVLWAAMPDENE